MTPESQLLHIRKYNAWWAQNVSKVKKTVRARLRWNEEQWCRNVDHSCLAVWVIDHCKTDSRAACHSFLLAHLLFQVSQAMLDSMLASFINGNLGLSRADATPI